MRKFLLVPVLLMASVAWADDCEFQADRSFTVDAASLAAVQIKTGPHDLSLQGEPGLKQVVVTAKACASDADDLEDLKLTQRRDGDRLIIEAGNPGSSGGFLLFPGYADLEIRIRVPDSMAVSVDSGSGDTTARDLQSLAYDAGSGDLDAERIREEVTAEAGSGDISVSGLGRFVLSSIGSGDTDLREVGGAVEIASVGSGNVTLRQVVGDVHVGSVGSGDVSVSGAASVTVDEIGSGDVDVEDVRGDFTVKDAGSSDITHRNVSGKVSVPTDD